MKKDRNCHVGQLKYFSGEVITFLKGLFIVPEHKDKVYIKKKNILV